jgi:hypothetical protein
MALVHTKSPQITPLDALPAIFNTEGEGGPGFVQTRIGYVIAGAADSIDTTYQFVRVPSNCKIHSITFESAAQAGGTVDLGLYYATDGLGNRPTTLLVANAIDRTLFAAAIAVTSASAPTQVINSAGKMPLNKRVQPLWQAAGLASDPGGNFDIVGSLAAAITTGTGLMGIAVALTD